MNFKELSGPSIINTHPLCFLGNGDQIFLWCKSAYRAIWIYTSWGSAHSMLLTRTGRISPMLLAFCARAGKGAEEWISGLFIPPRLAEFHRDDFSTGQLIYCECGFLENRNPFLPAPLGRDTEGLYSDNYYKYSHSFSYVANSIHGAVHLNHLKKSGVTPLTSVELFQSFTGVGSEFGPRSVWLSLFYRWGNRSRNVQNCPRILGGQSETPIGLIFRDIQNTS